MQPENSYHFETYFRNLNFWDSESKLPNPIVSYKQYQAANQCWSPPQEMRSVGGMRRITRARERLKIQQRVGAYYISVQICDRGDFITFLPITSIWVCILWRQPTSIKSLFREDHSKYYLRAGIPILCLMLWEFKERIVSRKIWWC
jgi:hypothetical protein